MGISQHVHGTDNARCLIALALVTGQIGRPGTGLHPLRGQNNVQGASDAGLIPMFFPDYQSVGTPDDAAPSWRRLWGATLDPAARPDGGRDHERDPRGATIRGMYIMGENPAMSDPDLNHARAALAKLDHLVVQDLFLTETAFYADVVLPASAFAEKTGSFTNTDRRVQLARPVLPPPGEARQDCGSSRRSRRRLGLDWNYAGPAEVFAEMAQAMPSLANITWERLEREGAVTYPVDGAGHARPRRSCSATASRPRAAAPHRARPTCRRPTRCPTPSIRMVLSTGRVLEHWHTGAMTRRAAVLDAIEPEAVALLSPQQNWPAGRLTPARRSGWRRGAARSRSTCAPIPTCRPGMVFIPFCYVEAAANLLTNPQLDPFGKIPEFKFCAARIAAVSVAAD